MSSSFDSVPRDKLVNAGRVHPGFKRIIAHQAIDLGVSAEERLHEILCYAIGDPGPVELGRRPLESARSS